MRFCIFVGCHTVSILLYLDCSSSLDSLQVLLQANYLLPGRHCSEDTRKEGTEALSLCQLSLQILLKYSLLEPVKCYVELCSVAASKIYF